MLAALQPVTLQDGKLVAVTPIAGGDGGLQTISLAQITQATSLPHNPAVSNIVSYSPAVLNVT